MDSHVDTNDQMYSDSTSEYWTAQESECKGQAKFLGVPQTPVGVSKILMTIQKRERASTKTHTWWRTSGHQHSSPPYKWTCAELHSEGVTKGEHWKPAQETLVSCRIQILRAIA